MICSCDHRAPPERVLRSSEFNAELPKFYCDRGQSGDLTINWVLTELYDYRTGQLFGPYGVEIPVEANGDVFDDAFSEDPRRWINRYLEKAMRPLKNRLDCRCVFGVTVLHFARQVYLCRTQGCCNR